MLAPFDAYFFSFSSYFDDFVFKEAAIRPIALIFPLYFPNPFFFD